MMCSWMPLKHPSFQMTPQSWTAGSQTSRTPRQTSASPCPGTTGSACPVTTWCQRSCWLPWMQTGLCCLGTGAERGFRTGKSSCLKSLLTPSVWESSGLQRVTEGIISVSSRRGVGTATTAGWRAKMWLLHLSTSSGLHKVGTLHLDGSE